MNPIISKFYYHTLLGNMFLFVAQKIYNNLPADAIILKHRYKKKMGKSLNLANPRTLNEKINWLKLNDRTPLHTLCADKYSVREYVSAKIGESYLVPLYYHTNNTREILPKNIHQFPCIIKTNHDSGGGIFIRNKDDVDWFGSQKKLRERMKKNYYTQSREWQYKNIKPSIIVEQLLQDQNGDIPLDYKLHCFNGRVRMISVDIGRGTEKHYRNWYDRNWKREPYKWSSPKGMGKFTDPRKEDVPKPSTLDEMIRLSEILSVPFDYVRVDWYDVDGKLYFGELTFHHDGGTKPILPEKWDFKLGNELRITGLKIERFELREI